MIGKLIIARHHESEWNKLGKWTGKVNVGLTQYGFEMARKMGDLIRGLPIDMAYASAQFRSLQTLLCMADGVCMDVPIIRGAALNERDYGDYTGLNKWEVKEKLGEAQFDKIRRGWDVSLPNGESLKMVYDRVIPYFKEKIMADLRAGKNVLIVAHGNSLRALMKYVEDIPDDAMEKVEMPFGSIIIYDLDKDGRMVNKQTKTVPSTVNA